MNLKVSILAQNNARDIFISIFRGFNKIQPCIIAFAKYVLNLMTRLEFKYSSDNGLASKRIK